MVTSSLFSTKPGEPYLLWLEHMVSVLMQSVCVHRGGVGRVVCEEFFSENMKSIDSCRLNSTYFDWINGLGEGTESVCPKQNRICEAPRMKREWEADMTIPCI